MGRNKKAVYTKEQADHSLPYTIAVAALDGQVLPEQYRPERILRDDLQSLLARVTVIPSYEYTQRFPEEHACKVTVATKDGRRFENEKTDYEGFHTRPMPWPAVEGKFRHLSAPYLSDRRQAELADVVRHLEDVAVSDLARLLAGVGRDEV